MFHVEHLGEFLLRLFHVEQWAGIVAGLDLAFGEIARIGPKARRSACFEAKKAETESFQRG